MAKMRILIRIVFVIFIANGIDCLGSDICCIHTKYENISKEGNIINLPKMKIKFQLNWREKIILK